MEIVGLVALLIAAGEALVRLRFRGRPIHANRGRLDAAPAADEIACPWPRLDPELENLRRKGAL